MPTRKPTAPVPGGRRQPGRRTPAQASPVQARPVGGNIDWTGAHGVRPAAGRSDVDPRGRRGLLLDLVRASPQPRSILSLAEELGVHANTVRFHLETLLRIGQVEQLFGDTTGPGRPPVLFRATRRMDPDGPTNYRLLASMLTSHLVGSSQDPAAAATELGRAWGPNLLAPATTDPTATGRASRARVKRGEALTRMTSALSDLGFAPEPPTGPRDTTIRLRHCPFLGLVTGTDTGTGYSEVICSLHLGMMQGALASLQGPVTVDRLDPFVEPDLCVAHLAPAATVDAARTAATGATTDNDPSPSSR